MKKLSESRLEFIRRMDVVYQDLQQKHYAAAPRNGDIPTGGGDWMDMHFRCEALRGCMGALRTGKKLHEAIADGRAVSSIAVGLWNNRREYQVHRWEQTAWDYLDRIIIQIRREMDRLK